ncbi:MAG: hypothetical protein WCS51_04490 [Bacilli bacterium]|jgi:hypothetical protein
MIKRKILVILGMSVILVTAAVTGVFSKYQSTVEAGSGSVTAKTFIVNTLDNENIDKPDSSKIYNESDIQNGIKMGPGEYLNKNFSVQNWGDGHTSESDIMVTLKLTWATSIVPLNCAIYSSDDDTFSNPLIYFSSDFSFTDVDSNYLPSATEYYTFKMLASGGAQTNKFKLRISWDEDSSYDQESYINSSAAYSLDVIGTQIVQSIPDIKTVMSTGFINLFNNTDNVIWKYLWTNDKVGTINGKLSTYNSGADTVIDSTGANWGKAHLTPELSDELGITKGLIEKDACYRVIRLGKSVVESDTYDLKNDHFPYDIYFSYNNITNYEHDDYIENVYHLNPLTGLLENGRCKIAKGNGIANQRLSASTIRNAGGISNTYVKYSDSPDVKIYDENTVFLNPGN